MTCKQFFVFLKSLRNGEQTLMGNIFGCFCAICKYLHNWKTNLSTWWRQRWNIQEENKAILNIVRANMYVWCASSFQNKAHVTTGNGTKSTASETSQAICSSSPQRGSIVTPACCLWRAWRLPAGGKGPSPLIFKSMLTSRACGKIQATASVTTWWPDEGSGVQLPLHRHEDGLTPVACLEDEWGSGAGPWGPGLLVDASLLAW